MKIVDEKKVTKKINFTWVGFGFGLFYWILESVRDVIIFEKGPLLKRIFLPDPISIWMRLLVVFILILFGICAQYLKDKMGARYKEPSKPTGPIHLLRIGLLFGVLYWLIESVRDTVVFQKGNILERILTPDPMGFWMRALSVGTIILFSIYVQARVNARRVAEEELKQRKEALEREVEKRTSELSESNRKLNQEITEKNQLLEQHRKLNRALKMLGTGNKALVHGTNESDLIDKICNIFIDIAGFHFAWVGLIEGNDRNNLNPVTKAGNDSGYLNEVNFERDDTEKGNNPVWVAIRSCEPCVFNYQIPELSKKSWYSEAVKRGFVSSLSVPLMDGQNVIGILNIYSSENHVFDFDEVNIIKEMTDDLTYGIVTLRTRTAHRQSEMEKKEIQAQLNQAQKMEEIGILAGGIAHDFNNVLTAILGCTELTLMEIEKEDRSYERLKDIRELTKNASAVVRQLLLFSRRHPMSLDNLDFNDVIHGLDKMFNHLIGENIKIKKDLDPDLWTIYADQGTLEQVIMNLVVNARDAMPDGGWIRIKAENKVIDEADCEDMPEAQTGKHICFSVTDTGQGIDPSIIQQIFEPFFTTKKSGKGTGLGLSVVYGIVKQHNGWIHVKSKAKRGSVFEVYLPAVPESIVEKSQETTSIKFQTGSGKRVLVVEDEEKILEFTANGLQKNGYDVSAATNIREAKEIYDKKDGDFSMVVSDVILPDGNGLDLVNTLTEQNPKLQVILSSGYTDHRSHWTTIKDKGFRFIEKPYDLSDLFRAIEDVSKSAPA